MDNSQSPGSIDMSQFNSQCVDPQDLSYAFDFNNQINSPVGGNGKGRMPIVTSSLASPTSAISQELTEEQRLMLPTHDYGRYKQQTGLPSQADHFRGLGQSQGMFSGYNSGVYEPQIWEGMGSQMDPNLEAYLEMSVANEDYIDPTAIMKQEEVSANIRYFPGMHQQAALQKQAMMAKQKQQRDAELQQQQQRSQPARRSASSQPLDPRTEETISRVMNEIRRRSDIATDSLSSPNGSNLPHIVRAKRDEEDMDEDERLLNSEECKKLSSKERRQLRNKVSARAFRSRRKEYIGQLEEEVAAKANDASELKRQNLLLMEENARFRALAEKLLAHPAFHPFLDELSRDPDLAESLSKVTNSPSTSQTQMPKDVDAFASSQQLYPPPNTTTHVGMTMIPEMTVDLSSLNIGSTGNWNSQPQHMAMFQTPQVFAVTELPTTPTETIDFEALSGKADVFSEYEDNKEEKLSMPEVESLSPVEGASVATVEAESLFDENDPTVTLFATSAPRSCPPTNEIEFQFSLEDILPEKATAHFELFVSTEEANQELSNGLSRMIARLESTNRRIDALLGC